MLWIQAVVKFIMENKKPQIIKDVGFDFNWDSKKVWKLDVPVTEININELIWHFYVPFWEKDGTDDYNLTPDEVIKGLEGTSEHRVKVDMADISYPIDVMENKGRLVILDGLHRLVKLYELGRKIVNIRIIPRDNIEQILKDK